MTKYRGIYMGMRGKRKNEPVFDPKPHHTAIIGPTGAGKTVKLMIPIVSTFPGSLIVADPKGEIASVTAERRREVGDVHIINPFSEAVNWYPDLESCKFNPVLRVDPEARAFAEDAMAIAEAYVIANSNAGDPHWNSSGAEVVRMLAMFEATRPEPSLGNVRDKLCLPYEAANASGTEAAVDPMLERLMPLLDKVGLPSNVVPFPPDRARQAAAAKSTSAPGSSPVDLGPRCFLDILRRIEQSPIKELRVKAQRFMQAGRELDSVLATARTQTQSLDSKLLRADLSTMRPLPFECLKERVTTIYVILPSREIHEHSRWLRLVFASALRALLASPASAIVGPVLCLMDEFAALEYFKPIEEAMGYARGYGVQIGIVLQDLPQLQRNYEKGWESFLGACSIMAFAPRDMTTANYLSALSGKYTREVPSISQDRQTGEWRPSIGAQGIPLFLPQDLIGMEDSELLCLVEGLPPFRTRVPVYTNTPFYWDGERPLRDNPYYKGRR